MQCIIHRKGRRGRKIEKKLKHALMVIVQLSSLLRRKMIIAMTLKKIIMPKRVANDIVLCARWLNSGPPNAPRNSTHIVEHFVPPLSCFHTVKIPRQEQACE
jgi:hypothetical protein